MIKSDTALDNGKQINDTIKNKEIVADYLAWLHIEFPEVLKLKSLKALDNQDKRELEDRSESEVSEFWDWLEENYPDMSGKKSIHDIMGYLSIFCDDNALDFNSVKKYFWNHSKYPKKKLRVKNNTFYGVIIPEKNDRTVEQQNS